MASSEVNTLISAIKGLSSPEWMNGPYYSMLQFSRFDDACKKLNLSVEGKRCIDLGCGPNKPYSNAVILYLLGASRVVAIDVQEALSAEVVAGRTYALLLGIAADQTILTSGSPERRKRVYERLARFNLRALAEGDLEEGIPKGIKHVVGDYRKLDSDLSRFDVCVSFSVFEHIAEFKSVVGQLYSNCSSGGGLFADIDYRDHRLYSAKASPWQYLVDDGDHEPGYINKIRHSEMIRALDDAGFDVTTTDIVRAPVPAEIRSNITPSNTHWSDDDLEILQAQVLLRKKRRWGAIFRT